MASSINIAELKEQEKLLTDYLNSGEKLTVHQIARLSREILRLRGDINFYENLRKTGPNFNCQIGKIIKKFDK
ncbi:MAG: hypothetical protein AB3N18_11180 [Allomuricauda sp.]